MTTTMVVPLLTPLRPRDDYFQSAMALVSDSFSLLKPLYRLDRDRGFEGRGTAESRSFTAQRLATGASTLRDLWWSAYERGTAKAASSHSR
jgi:hypothetical protein